jgi:biopolymer transport protein ExbB/TolQ
MTSPKRFVIRMVFFLLAVAIVCGFLFLPLQKAFIANIGLNSLIIGVLILGIAYNFRQVFMLYPEVTWIESYRTSLSDRNLVKQPKLLSSMATMLGQHKDSMSLSTLSMRSLLDGIASRLDESRDLSRYNIALLIFLGLLGTFWGLLETIGSIKNVIDNLSVSGGDFTAIFSNLKSGLSAPLSGMGTAFSSSLFGLAGSLILGFLDLQASQSQNRFYNDLEEWLSSLTRLSSGGVVTEGDQSVPAYVQALLEQTAESLENLQRTLTRGAESNNQNNSNLARLTENLSTLGDQLQIEQNLLSKLAESQTNLGSTLERLVEAQNNGIDEVTQNHIRNIDSSIARLLEEISIGRDDLIKQLRSEIKLLARTIAASQEKNG